MSRFSRVESISCAEVSDGSLATSGRSSCVIRRSIYGCSRRRFSFWNKIKKVLEEQLMSTAGKTRLYRNSLISSKRVLSILKYGTKVD